MGLRKSQISQNSNLWSFSQKVFTGFTSVLLHMLIASTFRGVENIGLRGPISRSFWGPKIDHNSGLQSFSQKFSTGFTSVLFYMLIGSTFRCTTMMCPKGPISAPRVQVSTELARSSGLLFL